MVVLNSLVNNDSSSWDPLHLSDSDVILKPKLMPCLMLTTDSLGHYRQVVVMMYGWVEPAAWLRALDSRH